VGLLTWMRERGTRRRAAERLYFAAVGAARQPAVYAALAVPDSVDGRFDMIALHVHLLLRRLRQLGSAGQALGQELVDVMVADMDRSLREMGVGDLSVGRQVKRMVKAFYGRGRAYDQAFGGDLADLHAALARNLYRGQPVAGAVLAAAGRYARAAERKHAGLASEALLSGVIEATQISVSPPGDD